MRLELLLQNLNIGILPHYYVNVIIIIIILNVGDNEIIADMLLN